MTEYSRFFGGPEGDIPEYTQVHDSEVYRLMFPTYGVITGEDNTLEVVETDPIALAVKVNTGWAFVHGFWYQNTAFVTKSLAAADPDDPRIDRIILRLDTTVDFEITIEVLEGTPGAVPAAPTLTQTDATYEISLAQVLVAALETSVSDTEITDERDYCEGGNVSLLTNVTGAKIIANNIIVMADGFKIDGSACELVEADGTAAKVYCKHLAVAKTEFFDVPKFRVPDEYDGGSLVINVCFRSAGAAKTHSLGIRVASVATGEVHNPDTAGAYQLYDEEASDAVPGKTKIKTVTVTQANHLMAAGEIWHCKCVMEDDAGADADDVFIDWIAFEWNKG